VNAGPGEMESWRRMRVCDNLSPWMENCSPVDGGVRAYYAQGMKAERAACAVECGR
jgi:hypothetical protein